MPKRPHSSSGRQPGVPGACRRRWTSVATTRAWPALWRLFITIQRTGMLNYTKPVDWLRVTPEYVCLSCAKAGDALGWLSTEAWHGFAGGMKAQEPFAGM